MGIFRRDKSSDRTDEAREATDERGDDELLDRPGPEAGSVEGRVDDGRADDGQPGPRGPFDSADVEDDEDRLDLGALRIKGVAGMELRLEIDESENQVVGATAVIGDSAVQIQAFAAPRTTGIWDDIRAEIAESILAQGGTADEVSGPLGTELRTRMPSAGPDGRTVFAPARFAGVDGPRWFLRAVFSGRAAIDDDAAAPLLDVVRDTVVVRGDAAMAPREMLALTLPQQVEPAPSQEGDPELNADDLKPFERGPEITEIR